jgi:hypothetical protein
VRLVCHRSLWALKSAGERTFRVLSWAGWRNAEAAWTGANRPL